MNLIYHNRASIEGGISPFDEVIMRLVRDADVLIACPYLSLDYLEIIIDQCRSWQLLTDVEEWLAIHNRTARLEISDFIAEHMERIHHYKNLHAKVVLVANGALVGSVNLTKKGITERAEMAILIDSQEQVEELQRWYAELWDQSAPVSLQEVEEYILQAPAGPVSQVNRPEVTISSLAPTIKAGLTTRSRGARRVAKLVGSHSQDSYDKLVERVKLAPSREWIEKYFDLVYELITCTGLSSDDPRLVTSIPQGKWQLPVSVNNRYVLSPFSAKRKEWIVGFIVGPNFEQIPELKLQDTLKYYGRFSALSGEMDIETPFFIRLGDIPDLDSCRTLKDEWINAVLNETRRATSSPYRRYHEAIVYDAVVNLDCRMEILDAAFPK